MSALQKRLELSRCTTCDITGLIHLFTLWPLALTVEYVIYYLTNFKAQLAFPQHNFSKPEQLNVAKAY